MDGRPARDAGRGARGAGQFKAEGLVEALALSLQQEAEPPVDLTLGDTLLQQRTGVKAERLGGVEPRDAPSRC